MSKPSPLGASIEATIEGSASFIRHHKTVQYLCCYKTTANTVFAFERVTLNGINFWMPDLSQVKKIAEASGYPIERKIPWLRRPKYGRISSLKSIPELRDEPLLKVQITSPSEALSILSALP